MELMKMVTMKSTRVKMWTLEMKTMQLIWRCTSLEKETRKILEEFQDAIVRIDKEILRIICIPRKENLSDYSRFENLFVIPENVYANEGSKLNDFLDIDSDKGETAHMTTISGRERMCALSKVEDYTRACN